MNSEVFCLERRRHRRPGLGIEPRSPSPTSVTDQRAETSHPVCFAQTGLKKRLHFCCFVIFSCRALSKFPLRQLPAGIRTSYDDGCHTAETRLSFSVGQLSDAGGAPFAGRHRHPQDPDHLHVRQDRGRGPRGDRQVLLQVPGPRLHRRRRGKRKSNERKPVSSCFSEIS